MTCTPNTGCPYEGHFSVSDFKICGIVFSASLWVEFSVTGTKKRPDVANL